ncbi:hypothetical protein ACI797_01380 [Geodermatophilus sp. SYSU D00691]
MHAAQPGHRSSGGGRGRWPVLLVALVLAVAGTVAVAVARSDDDPPPTTQQDETVAPPPETGRNVVVQWVNPVGGQLPGGGTQTVESARAEVGAAADYGAIGVRVTADLSWLCQSPDRPCRTEPLDPLVDRARELGLEVYLHVNSTPTWIDDRGTWYGPEGEGAEEWAALFAQLVARWGTQVAGYEVWNEPNIREAWRQGPDPGAYADLLKAVWTAVQDVEPDAQLIGGVLSNNDLGYMHALSEALAERGGNAENGFYYDQLGVHPYAGAEGVGYDPKVVAGQHDVETDFGVKDMTFLGVERLRDQVYEDEGIRRDVVIGEFGYDTTPGAWYHVAEPERSEYLSEALHIAASWDWVEAFTVYTGDGFAVEGTPSETALRQTTASLSN